MLNGTNDELIPKRNGGLVHEAARGPKKLVWLESGHVRTEKVELTRAIVETLRTELGTLSILP